MNRNETPPGWPSRVDGQFCDRCNHDTGSYGHYAACAAPVLRGVST
jgi:hypothetical protein